MTDKKPAAKAATDDAPAPPCMTHTPRPDVSTVDGKPVVTTEEQA
jgi:hypothetical protein